MTPEPISSDPNSGPDFIDREDILRELGHYKDLAASGNGMCVFLKGETGVGKTRIAEEFLKDCKKSGFKILRGRCLYYEGTEPYLPFYEALEEQMEEENKEEDEMAGPAFISQPASSSGSAKSTPMSFIGSEEEEEEIKNDVSFSDQQDMMFNRITEVLKDISKKQPVIFFLDDLQWIDESSAQLLHHLARNISEDKIFLLGAFRPEELRYEEENPPLEDTLTRMKEEKIVDIVKIPRLDQPSVSKLIKKYLKREDLPDDFTWAIYRESEGNPFYVIEILNSMMQEGVIDPHSYTWDPEKELSNVTIPSSIKDITSRKIEKLDKQEKKVLMFASVLGTEFNFQLLEKVVDIDVIELLDIIDNLEEQGLLQEIQDADEELYRFHHLQTRTVLYNKMGKSRKRITHRRVGEILEDSYEDELEEHLFDLSRHFFKGKEYKNAYEYSKKAAEQSLQGLDISTAIDQFEKTLEALKKGEEIENVEEKEKEILERIGELYYDSNDWDSAKDIYITMIRRGRKIDDRKMEAIGLRRLGHVYKEIQDYKKAEGYCEQGLELAKKLEDSRGIAEANRGLGYIRWREGKFEKAERYYREAIDKAKQSNDDKELALNYLALGSIYAQKGKHERAIEFFEKSLPPLEARNVYRHLARAHNNIGDQYMRKEEWEKALKYFDECIEYAEKIGNEQYLGWGSFNAAEVCSRMGDPKKASEYIEGIDDLMKEIGDDIGLAAVQYVKGLIKQEEGHLKEAIEFYEDAIEIMEDLEVPFNKAQYRLSLGLAYKEMKQYEKAKKELEKAKETFEELDTSGKYIDKARNALTAISEKGSRKRIG